MTNGVAFNGHTFAGTTLNPNEPSLKRVSIELEPALMRYGSCKLNGTNLEMT